MLGVTHVRVFLCIITASFPKTKHGKKKRKNQDCRRHGLRLKAAAGVSRRVLRHGAGTIAFKFSIEEVDERRPAARQSTLVLAMRLCSGECSGTNCTEKPFRCAKIYIASYVCLFVVCLSVIVLLQTRGYAQEFQCTCFKLFLTCTDGNRLLYSILFYIKSAGNLNTCDKKQMLTKCQTAR